MPTVHAGKVRHMLKDGRAVIYKHRPFTIQLTYETTEYVQPVEYCEDTGDHYAGVSVKSEKREYRSDEYRPLPDEKKKHEKRAEHRSSRRNRKRHRKPRFDNRKNRKGKLPPSIEHKVDVNLKPFLDIVEVCPITRAVFEIGAFDTQRLQAIQKGEALPEGKDYQQGPMYNFNTLRDAVFFRDKYTCQFCGKGIDDGRILRVHHALYWKGRHGNQLDELVTCCTKCHTAANHKKGGKLYGFTPKEFTSYAGASTMNQIRKRIVYKARKAAPHVDIQVTYGADTKAMRKYLGLEKSHVNDAYCMGEFHPERRAEQHIFQKVRRNNRVLEKFYDATYIDSRDRKKKKGAELSSGRVVRNKESSKNGENLRRFRQSKVSKGRRTIREKRYPIRPGDILLYDGKRYISGGCLHYGDYVRLKGTGKAPSVRKVRLVKHCGGYREVDPNEKDA